MNNKFYGNTILGTKVYVELFHKNQNVIHYLEPIR